MHFEIQLNELGVAIVSRKLNGNHQLEILID